MKQLLQIHIMKEYKKGGIFLWVEDYQVVQLLTVKESQL